jgi:crotonobetainyl-CoA:carnitine CoA-transferase CaiB-like acyl-CoA transferase
VYLSISGFGQTGPRAGERAYDPIIQFYSGIAATQGRIHLEHPNQPEQVNQLILDKLTAYTGCQAITAALLERSKSGVGQHVELSMLDTAIAFLWPDTAADLILQGDGVDARPPVGARATSRNIATDGAPHDAVGRQFHGMCAPVATTRPDPRFATLAARQRNCPALIEVLRGEMAGRREVSLAEAAERDAAEDVLRKCGV